MQSNDPEIFGSSRQITYLWPIENLVHRLESAEPIKARFYFDHHKNDGWYVRLHPKGCQGNSDESELLIKFVSRENNTISVGCTITFDKLSTDALKFLTMNETFHNGQVHVMRPFITRAMVPEPSKLSPNGAVTIRFNMKYIIHRDQKYQNTGSEISTNCLIDDLSYLHDHPKLTDVTIKVGDVDYPAHKVILAARSPVFSEMFEHPEMSGDSDNQINISAFEPAIIKQLLRYIYTGQADISGEILPGLLLAANKYGLENLKLRCAQLILCSINKNNAAEILIIADCADATKLKADVVAYIDNNLGDIIDTAGYKDLGNNHPHLLREFVRLSVAKRPRINKLK